MSSTELLQWAAENERAYADDYIATTNILRQNDVYKTLGSYLLVTTLALKARYQIPKERPIVHIDVGCGVGDALGEMSEKLRQERKGHVLVGIDINEHMCRAAIQNLLDRGNIVEGHVHQRRKISTSGRTRRLERDFPVRLDRLRSMNLSPDGRILILQDDIRKRTSVLGATLEELHSRHGIHHVDSISFSQPGLSGDSVASGKALPDIARYRSDEKERNIGMATYLKGFTDAVTDRARELLGFGGSYVTVNRLANGNRLEDLYKALTRQEYPHDEMEQIFARMLVSMFMLREKGDAFSPKAGAIIYPNYHSLESGTPIGYATFSPMRKAVKDNIVENTYDLFALTAVRKDLHPMTKDATAFHVEM